MLFGSSGIRTVFDRTLLTISYSSAAACAQSAGTILLGRDTRRTSPVLSQGFIAGALAAGADLYDAGIAPTPTIGYGARHMDAACMITASHNPEEYNGLKFFNPDGSSFSELQQREMEGRMQIPAWVPWNQQGSLILTDALGPHATAIRDSVTCSKLLKVIVDCGNGAGSVMTPWLLKMLGCEVIPINCNIADRFSRPSEPLPAHLPYLSDVLRKTKADWALVHDGDADRLVVVDGEGQFISGDDLLILFASYLEAKKIVTTQDASRAIEAYGEVQRTPVGDSFVSERLRSWGQFGGEPSGTFTFPHLSLCPDGIFAAALFCEIATEWNVRDELAKIPRYFMTRVSFPSPAHREVLTALGATNPTDGIRIEREDGWFLIRASGTEPKIRITVEGKTESICSQLQDDAQRMIRDAEKGVRPPR